MPGEGEYRHLRTKTIEGTATMPGTRAISLLMAAALCVAPSLLGSAEAKPRPTRVVIDRLTYLDGTERSGSRPALVWLGFDAARSSESVATDIPGTRTSYVVAPSDVPEHFESVTVDLARPGDLTVVMTGRSNGIADPRAVPDSANGDGIEKGRRVIWKVRKADAGTYSFTARFRPRWFEPSFSTFMPESRVTLASTARSHSLIFKQHVAPAYGPPRMSAGRAHESVKPVAYPDEWVANPSYVAHGNYHWSTGAVGASKELTFSKLGSGAATAFTTGSMGTSSSTPPTGPKVRTAYDFLYGRSGIEGFSYGIRTADALGDFIPFDTRPTGGTIYDGDSGTFAIGMAAASVNAKEKRLPRNNEGRLVWDWDGGWAKGWSTTDEHGTPVLEAADTGSILMQESVLYVRAAGGDVDNRKGSSPVRGPRMVLKFPAGEFGFIFYGGSAPPKSMYRTQAGFTKNDDFFMRPTIAPRGYLLEGTTKGYFRDWQAAELLTVSTFGAEPDNEPNVTRLFNFAPGLTGRIVAATTDGLIERFNVGPGTWQLTATPEGFLLRAFRGI